MIIKDKSGTILFDGSKKCIWMFYAIYGAEILTITNIKYLLQIPGEKPYIYDTVKNILTACLEDKNFNGGTLNNGMKITM